MTNYTGAILPAGPAKNHLNTLSEYKHMPTKIPQNLNQPQQNQNANPKKQM